MGFRVWKLYGPGLTGLTFRSYVFGFVQALWRGSLASLRFGLGSEVACHSFASTEPKGCACQQEPKAPKQETNTVSFVQSRMMNRIRKLQFNGQWIEQLLREAAVREILQKVRRRHETASKLLSLLCNTLHRFQCGRLSKLGSLFGSLI